MGLISAIPGGQQQANTGSRSFFRSLGGHAGQAQPNANQTQPNAGQTQPQTQPNIGFTPTPGGSIFLQRNLVRLVEEELPLSAEGVTMSRFTKTAVAPIPITYYVENPLTDEVVQVLSTRLGPRSSAIDVETIPETTVVTYNPLGGAPIVELGDDFIIPGTEGSRISSLRFRQAKRIGSSPAP